MTTEFPYKNLTEDNIIQEKESNSRPNSIPPSFSNYIDQNTILPYKSFLKENLKSFNLLPNEENSTKENELENSLKAKYNFDTPTLEIILKVTCDYDLIEKKLREYLELFGEINSLKYDHNANTIKINYKYYFSCLYANRSLTNILQKEKEENTAINYYSNCDFNNKYINEAISNEKHLNKINSNKDFTQAFKFLTENYKTNTRFKTQIYKEEKEDSCENIINAEISRHNNAESGKDNEDLNNDSKELEYSSNLKTPSEKENFNTNSDNNKRSKCKWANNYNNYYNSRKKLNNSFTNSINNILFPPNLFYQYLSMNNPNTIKIPIPVPIPLPVPMPITLQKLNKNISSSKSKIKTSCFNQTKKKEENIPISLNQTKMKTESNSNINDSLKGNISNNSNKINNFYDSPILNDSNNIQKSNSPKINVNSIEKEEYDNEYRKEVLYMNNEQDKDINNDKENNSSNSNISGKVHQENKCKNDLISSIKLTEKNNMDILSTVDQKKLSLDRLNYFLQNNKPISNFNNPIKNLSSEENELSPKNSKRIPYPIFLPIPMQFPFKFPKFKKNQYFNTPFPIEFNKNIIDFDKLTLNTKNTIKFETYSSRDYYYKYVCNYLVQIENDDNFLVTKRIIGKNGCFLKKIIQEACIKYGDFSTKIRLRGKGSGYLEQNGKESEEPLMLCVSSLNYPTYFNCCLLIDNLLKKVYNDYHDYLLKILPKELHYSIRKKEVLKHEFVVNRYGNSGKNKEEKNGNYKANKNEEPSELCQFDEKINKVI